MRLIEQRLVKIETDLALLKWMASCNVALSIVILGVLLRIDA